MLHSRTSAVCALLVLSLAGFLLRLTNLVLLQIAVAVLAFGLAFLIARSQAPENTFPSVHPSAVLLLPLLSALLFAVSAALALRSGQWLSAASDLVSAVCLVLLTLSARTKTAPPFPVCAVLTLGLICKLILGFRAWSVNPHLMDYCFRLFSLVFTMLAALHLGGFAISEGRRRLTVFYCGCGTVFSAISIANGGFSDLLVPVACFLFLLSAFLQLTAPQENTNRPQQ